MIAQFLRFNAVGVITTVLAYLVYAVLVLAGVHQAVAVVADYAVGIVLGFALNRHFTFGAGDRSVQAMLGRLVLVYVPVAAANVYLLQVLVDGGLNPYIAQIIVLSALACVAYLLQKYFVFGASRAEEHG